MALFDGESFTKVTPPPALDAQSGWNQFISMSGIQIPNVAHELTATVSGRVLNVSA